MSATAAVSPRVGEAGERAGAFLRGSAFSLGGAGAPAVRLNGVSLPDELDGASKIKSMGRRRKLLERILSGSSDVNVPFDQTRTLLKGLGFSESIRGSHHKFVREGVEELIKVLLKYNLGQEL